MPMLLGVFDQPDHIAGAAKKLGDRGYTDLETFSPAPFAEVDDAVLEKPSPVRLYTLIGGRGNDIKLGETGDDLLISNNGDGSDLIQIAEIANTTVGNFETGAGADNDIFVGA